MRRQDKPVSTGTLRRAALAVMLSVAACAPLAAQEEESRNLPGWSFTPGASLSWAFDSNVALADAPASTGRTAGDQLFIIAPFGQLEFRSPRTNFSGGYRGVLRRYSDVNQLNGFDQRVNVSVQRAASKRLNLYMSDTLLQAPTTDEIELNGVPFSRRGFRLNSFSAGATGRLTKFTDLSAGYDNTWVVFDEGEEGEPGPITNGMLHGLRSGLSRRLNERTVLGADYAMRWADINDGTRELTFQDVGASLGYQLQYTRLSAAAGLSHISDGLLDEDRTGPFIRVGVTHELVRATLGASFERIFVPSFSFGGSSQSQELRGFIQMPLSRNRLYVQASGSWRRTDPLVETALQLDTYRVRSSVGYAASRWLRAEGFYVFTRQDSSVVGGEVNRHRIGIQTVIAQPMRIR